MKTRRLLLNLALLAGVLAGRMACAQAAAGPTASQLATPEEKHLRNVRQLTFGGSNAAAYFPIYARQLAVRPDLYHECGRDGAEDGLDRQGAHDLRLHFST